MRIREQQSRPLNSPHVASASGCSDSDGETAAPRQDARAVGLTRGAPAADELQKPDLESGGRLLG
jgi:hypothetical protein